MIKIGCTEAEKEQLILTMASGACPFAMTEGHKCESDSCTACIEQNIEWDMQEGGA